MATRREIIRQLLMAALAGVASSTRAAGPSLRSLQLVVPTPPGTQPDLVARLLIAPMALSAGVPGVVLNRPGAAGAIAADTVLAAPAETGSLLLSGLDAVAYSHLNSERRRLDPFVDFVPVGAASRDTWLLVVPKDSSIGTVADLVDASRRSSLNYASGGEGSTPHLLSARFVRDLGIAAMHVPYKQSFLPDLVAGRIDFVIAPTPAVLPQVRSGQLKALASLTDERLEIAADIPTIRELGRADQVFYAGLFIFAPSTLSARAGDINRWLLDAVSQPAIKARYREAGIEPVEQDVAQVREAVADRLRTVDAMREAVFGRRQSHRRPVPSAPLERSRRTA
jgi:tripartite-type tricarboxylate transporter receptor subunit TctC